jgi:hypothetical protein
MRFRKNPRSDSQSSPDMTAEKFREYTDFLVELYRLDPELPEIISLKKQAEELVSLDVPRPHYFLAMLNPDRDITDYEGVKVLQERWFGHILQAWSLARHHCPRLDEELVKIVVDGQGAHLFMSYMREHQVFWVCGAAINPHRMADPGNRYEIACELIRELTGIEIDYREQVGHTRKITVTKDVDSAWQVEFDRVEAISD